MLIPLGILASSGGGAAGAYELIETVAGSGASSVSFTSIPSTYKHLQIRWTARGSNTGSLGIVLTTFNSDTGANYTFHQLSGDGSSVTSAGSGGLSSARLGVYVGSNQTANSFGFGVTDILDYSSTSKNKTVRSLSGVHTDADKIIRMFSGLWASTSAISSLTISGGYNFSSASRFSLYGVKG